MRRAFGEDGRGARSALTQRSVSNRREQNAKPCRNWGALNRPRRMGSDDIQRGCRKCSCFMSSSLRDNFGGRLFGKQSPCLGIATTGFLGGLGGCLLRFLYGGEGGLSGTAHCHDVTLFRDGQFVDCVDVFAWHRQRVTLSNREGGRWQGLVLSQSRFERPRASAFGWRHIP